MIPPRATQTVAAPKTGAEAAAVLRLSCQSCGKSYRIRRSRIPLTASLVTCKRCGKKIRFRKKPLGAAPGPGRAAGQPAKLLRFRFDLMTPQKRPPIRRFSF